MPYDEIKPFFRTLAKASGDVIAPRYRDLYARLLDGRGS